MKNILHAHIPKWLIIAWTLTAWFWFALFYVAVAVYLIYRLAFNHEPVTFTEVAGGYAAKRYHDHPLRDRRSRLKMIVFGK